MLRFATALRTFSVSSSTPSSFSLFTIRTSLFATRPLKKGRKIPKIIRDTTTTVDKRAVIPLYSRPYGIGAKIVFWVLRAQVIATTFAVAYITISPLQDLLPIPDSVMERFLPDTDPNDVIARDQALQETGKKYVVTIFVAWIASCLALYFRRSHFQRQITGAQFVRNNKKPSSLALEIEYFFSKKRRLEASDILRETPVSGREWGLVVKPEKPYTFFSFQEEHLSGGSKQMMLNFMHNRDIEESTLNSFDPTSESIEPVYNDYVFGKKKNKKQRKE